MAGSPAVTENKFLFGSSPGALRLPRMDKDYWNRVGRAYDEEIFDVRANDRNGTVESAIDAFADKGGTAFDFGCGPGKFSDYLAPRFAQVDALDISESCLSEAKEACAGHSNIEFRQVDLSAPKPRFRAARFGLCVNVLLSKSHRRRRGILRFIKRHICKGGHLAVVVPALESVMLTSARRIEWNLKDGAKYRSAAEGDESFVEKEGASVPHGLVTIDGTPTKHFLKEELEMTLREFSFEMKFAKKVEYDWTSEFTEPPKWMREPFPWDWLAVAKRV